MPEILDVPFGGLSGLVHPNRVPLDAAITATDCFLDDNTVTGRSGYRSALQTAISTGNPQFLGRFQPDISLPAHTVVSISGSIWLVSEPSSDLASDAVATLLGINVFGVNDRISGAQLGTNYYLATDNVVPKWIRITSALAIEVLQQLPTPPLPSFSLSSLTFVTFPVYTSHWTFAGGVAGSTLSPPWIGISGSIGGTATQDLTLGGVVPAYNWQNTKWLMMAVSPMTQGAGGGQFKISLGNAANVFVGIQTIYDTIGADSPFAAYLLLDGIDKTVLAAVTQIRFTQIGPGSGYFAVLGYMPINTPPEPGTVPYYVTYFNSVTGAESALSPVTNVVYNNNGVAFPHYEAGRWHSGAFIDAGNQSTNPETIPQAANFNAGAGLQSPSASDFAPVYTFSGTIATGALYSNSDTVRLYRGTPNGISLVGSSVYSTDGTAANAKRSDGSAWTTGTGTVSDLPSNVTYWKAAGTTWSITDNTGASASANSIYQPGGPGPRTVAMCSIAGRLVAAYGNRVYISSFTPVTAASNLIPEWPPIAVQDANGWSFDVDPAPTEKILSVVSGDALYICTDRRVLVLRDLTPGTVPFQVFDRGVLGRQAATYAEDMLIWAAYDGVYTAQNVANTAELSQVIRIYVYQDQFLPDSTVAIGYQLRKLHVFRGAKRLRYDFVTHKWTGPDTLANSIFSALTFVSTSTALMEQLWVLTSNLFVSRLQPFCSLDNQIDQGAGVSPPDWKYSTGFSRTAKPGFITELSVLASGVVTAKVSKTIDALEPDEARILVGNTQLWRTEVDFPGPTDLRGKKLRVEFSGTNQVTLYSTHMQREEIDARGG